MLFENGLCESHDLRTHSSHGRRERSKCHSSPLVALPRVVDSWRRLRLARLGSTWVREPVVACLQITYLCRDEVHVYRGKVRNCFRSEPLVKLTVSSPIHVKIKEKIVESTERDTIHIFRTMHNTARVFKNKVSEEVVAIERRPGSKFEDIRHLVAGARGRKVYELGDPEYGVWSLGLSVGLIGDIPTCEELVRRMESEAEEMLSGGIGRNLSAKL